MLFDLTHSLKTAPVRGREFGKMRPCLMGIQAVQKSRFTEAPSRG